MKINLSSKSFKKIKSDIEIILVNDLEEAKDKELLENLDFKATDEACVLLAESGKIYVGYEEENYDSLAIAIATAVKKFKTTKYKTAKVNLTQIEDNLKAIVEGTLLASYSFKKYKSEDTAKKKQELILVVSEETAVLEECEVLLK